jgi:hypothetical protein
MSPAAFLVLLLAFGPQPSLRGVIDRVEGDYAVVAWDDLALSDVPLGMVQGQVREGRSICLRALLDEQGPYVARGEALIPLPAWMPELDVLPAPSDLLEGARYAMDLRCPCPGPILQPSHLAAHLGPGPRKNPRGRSSAAHPPNQPLIERESP